MEQLVELRVEGDLCFELEGGFVVAEGGAEGGCDVQELRHGGGVGLPFGDGNGDGVGGGEVVSLCLPEWDSGGEGGQHGGGNDCGLHSERNRKRLS